MAEGDQGSNVAWKNEAFTGDGMAEDTEGYERFKQQRTKNEQDADEYLKQITGRGERGGEQRRGLKGWLSRLTRGNPPRDQDGGQANQAAQVNRENAAVGYGAEVDRQIQTAMDNMAEQDREIKAKRDLDAAKKQVGGLAKFDGVVVDDFKKALNGDWRAYDLAEASMGELRARGDAVVHTVDAGMKAIKPEVDRKKAEDLAKEAEKQRIKQAEADERAVKAREREEKNRPKVAEEIFNRAMGRLSADQRRVVEAAMAGDQASMDAARSFVDLLGDSDQQAEAAMLRGRLDQAVANNSKLGDESYPRDPGSVGSRSKARESWRGYLADAAGGGKALTPAQSAVGRVLRVDVNNTETHQLREMVRRAMANLDASNAPIEVADYVRWMNETYGGVSPEKEELTENISVTENSSAIGADLTGEEADGVVGAQTELGAEVVGGESVDEESSGFDSRTGSEDGVSGEVQTAVGGDSGAVEKEETSEEVVTEAEESVRGNELSGARAEAEQALQKLEDGKSWKLAEGRGVVLQAIRSGEGLEKAKGQVEKWMENGWLDSSEMQELHSILNKAFEEAKVDSGKIEENEGSEDLINRSIDALRDLARSSDPAVMARLDEAIKKYYDASQIEDGISMMEDIANNSDIAETQTAANTVLAAWRDFLRVKNETDAILARRQSEMAA